MTTPARPGPVQLVGDGFSIDISDRLSYAGRDSAGTHQWSVALDDHEWTAVLHGERTVHIDVLPPHTSLAPATTFEAATAKLRRFLAVLDHPTLYSTAPDDGVMWMVGGIAITFGDLRQLARYERALRNERC